MEEERKFGKEQLLGASRYRGRRDLLNILLKDGESYSFAETDSLIEGYLMKEVK